MIKASMPRFWYFLSSFCLASTVILYDLVAFNKKPISKWPVDLSSIGISRSLIIAAAAYLLVSAMRPLRIVVYRKLLRNYFYTVRLESAFTWAFFIFVVVIVAVNGGLLRRFGNEDGIVENMAAIFLLIATLLMFSLLRFAGEEHSVKPATAAIVIRVWILSSLLGLLFMIIFLEEISWGQRIFGFQTPDAFLQNKQKEANLHNFYTWLFENLYYATAFCAFVLLPYAAAGTRRRRDRLTSVFIPAPEFVVIAAPVAFLQAEMWNNVPVQLAAWATFFILLDLARATQEKTRNLILSSLTVCAIGQALFLARADAIGHWLTEYKETMIAFLCLAYAATATKRARIDPWVWMKVSDPWLRLYLGMALLTFVFQLFVRFSQCAGTQDCILSFAKAIVWSTLWPGYWVVYSAPFGP